ncbi:MAG: ATP-binding protein [Phyllobacterium sp.]|jgi:signal transduction histidine kinase|uniref:ATP-binding protein n=1 Tax=Phyllobacterium sp. TaxID=1871046 RepID=UPI0030F2E9A3
MNSLRNRIAILLILAIVTVVTLATLAANTALRPPLPQTTMEPVARQLHLIIKMIEADPADAVTAGVRLQQGPATGAPEDILSELLVKALSQTGRSRTAFITRNEDRPGITASIKLESGQWLIADVPDFSPQPGRWKILAGWIVLIIFGSTAVSVFAASKITRPLRLLDNAVAAVGPDGVLPHVPEIGSGEVRATAQTLNRLSDRLKTAMESRMRLVAAAGHDLRTPMTRMRLRAEFLPEDAERQKWLNDLEELNTIADSAIRLVREEAGHDNIKDTRLDHVINEIVEELSGLDMKVEAQGMKALSIGASPMALKRALRNLIINGATHGKGAKVAMEHHGDVAVVTIADSGPGIPSELLDRVFEPFFRVDISRRKAIAGAGLGLAIAKEIIERFGGTITVANRKPAGLLQTVSFKTR